MPRRFLLLFITVSVSALLLLLWACGSTREKQVDLCACDPTAPASRDYRTVAKHADLPPGTATEISVADVLNFDVGMIPAADAARSGRELRLFHIAHAFAQLVWVVPDDCDIHVEISDTADKAAPRIIVETPRNTSFCQSRQQLAGQFNAHGVIIDNNRQELNPPLPIDVRGLAFQDEPHVTRGSALVGTVWELHPAVVTVQ